MEELIQAIEGTYHINSLKESLQIRNGNSLDLNIFFKNIHLSATMEELIQATAIEGTYHINRSLILSHEIF